MILPPNIPIYGDTSYRGKCPTETAEQITLVSAVRRQWPNTIGRVMIHVKNEGKRRHSQATWDQANGMVKGASDIMAPGCPSLVMELKRKDHTQSRISDEQVEYLEASHEMGAWVCIALGWEAAFAAVKAWSSVRA